MILDAWGWCTETTQRDGTGKEVGGGFRMGYMCIRKKYSIKNVPSTVIGVFIKLQAQRLFYSNSIQTLVDLVRSYFVSVDVVPVA